MKHTPIEPQRVMAAEGIEQHDVEAVNSATRRTLYAARVPIYPKRVHGAFRRLKWLVLILTLGVYYLLPWMRWERGPGEPTQAVLVDFAGNRFYFFFIEIWPDELYYVTGLLILAALGLFLVTALLGRVWCGYACPQTVWTDLYLLVERWIEGDRAERIRLDKSKWSAAKLGKKATKHVVWLLIAAATGGAWVFYFHDAPTILPQIFTGEAPMSAYLFIGILTFTTYMLAGSLREQVCTYMCPWPRIQAALMDEHALSVTYRTDRGEPRGYHKKGQSWDGRGDCIDCKQCVAACPMGIDIRDGAQLECINCALCIDACDEIMDKVGRPRGLIAYDTDVNVENRLKGRPTGFRFIRPRTIVYAFAFGLVAAIMLYALANRATLEVNVLRERAPPFVRLSDGSIRNTFTVKIVNKANTEMTFAIRFEGPDGLVLRTINEPVEGQTVTATAAGDTVVPVRIFATLPKDAVTAPSLPLTVTVTSTLTGETSHNATVFLSD